MKHIAAITCVPGSAKIDWPVVTWQMLTDLFAIPQQIGAVAGAFFLMFAPDKWLE